jgi:hypothetical protein
MYMESLKLSVFIIAGPKKKGCLLIRGCWIEALLYWALILYSRVIFHPAKKKKYKED